MPSEKPFLRINLDKCESKSFYESSQGTALQTFEDYLSEAEKTDNNQLRNIFLIRASQLAMGKNLFAKSIEILEMVDKTSQSQEIWKAQRIDSTVQLAITYYKDNSIGELYRVMNGLPIELKLDGKIQLIRFLLEEKKNSYDIVNDLLTDIEKENERFIFANDESNGYGLVLSFFYSDYAEKLNESPNQSLSALTKAGQENECR